MQPSKILILDDSRIMHKMFSTLLRQFNVVHAHDGIDALQSLRNHPEIDLIILDNNLSRMSALEFLSQIQGDSAFQNIPVLMIGSKENTLKAMKAGASAYLNKPFGRHEFFDVIERM